MMQRFQPDHVNARALFLRADVVMTSCRLSFAAMRREREVHHRRVQQHPPEPPHGRARRLLHALQFQLHVNAAVYEPQLRPGKRIFIFFLRFPSIGLLVLAVSLYSTSSPCLLFLLDSCSLSTASRSATPTSHRCSRIRNSTASR